MIDIYVEDPMIIVFNKYEGLIRDVCGMLNGCEVFFRKVIFRMMENDKGRLFPRTISSIAFCCKTRARASFS